MTESLHNQLLSLLGNLYGPGFVLYANMATYATIDTYSNGCMHNWEVLLCGIAGLVLGVPMASVSSSVARFETNLLIGIFGIIICMHSTFGIFGANAVVSVGACVVGLIGSSVFGVDGKPSGDIPLTVAVSSVVVLVYHIVSISEGFSPEYSGVTCDRDYAGIGVFFGALLHGIFFCGFVRQYSSEWSYMLSAMGVGLLPLCLHAYYPKSFIVPTMIDSQLL